MSKLRNFWIDCHIDGRKTPLCGGPAQKDGGFTLTIHMRSDGGCISPVIITGTALDDGCLMLEVRGRKAYSTQR